MLDYLDRDDRVELGSVGRDIGSELTVEVGYRNRDVGYVPVVSAYIYGEYVVPKVSKPYRESVFAGSKVRDPSRHWKKLLHKVEHHFVGAEAGHRSRLSRMG